MASETVGAYVIRRLRENGSPHIGPEQARNLAGALAEGDPARGRILREALKAN